MLLGDYMRKFIYVAEVRMDEKRCDEIESWGMLAEDFIDSVLTDHGKDRGLIMKTRAIETDKSKYDLVINTIFDSIREDLTEEIEKEILTNRMCLGGNCEV